MTRHSIRSTEGYLIIDHRASPGLPADIYQRMGIKVPPGMKVGEGQLTEIATMTCCHCNAIVILNPQRTRDRSYCRSCDGYICDKPECHVECVPFEKRVEQRGFNLPLIGERNG